MARHIVVTGAAKLGLGQAITHRLLTEGFNVFGSFEPEDRENAKALLRQFSGGNLFLLETNHADPSQLVSFAARAPSNLEGVVHAQFFFAMEDPENFDHALWDRSLAINLTAPNLLTHALKRKLKENGSICFITSTEGFIGSFGASAYAAAKAAVHNLTKSFANTLGTRGIRVNAVAAGWIGGVMDTDEVFNMSRRITPLGRLGSPDEVASVVSYLVGSASTFVNGTVLVVDGGYSGVDTIAKYEFDQARGIST